MAKLSRIAPKQFLYVCMFDFFKLILTEFLSFQPFGGFKVINASTSFIRILSCIMFYILYF